MVMVLVDSRSTASVIAALSWIWQELRAVRCRSQEVGLPWPCQLESG